MQTSSLASYFSSSSSHHSDWCGRHPGGGVRRPLPALTCSRVRRDERHVECETRLTTEQIKGVETHTLTYGHELPVSAVEHSVTDQSLSLCSHHPHILLLEARSHTTHARNFTTSSQPPIGCEIFQTRDGHHTFLRVGASVPVVSGTGTSSHRIRPLRCSTAPRPSPHRGATRHNHTYERTPSRLRSTRTFISHTSMDDRVQLPRPRRHPKVLHVLHVLCTRQLFQRTVSMKDTRASCQLSCPSFQTGSFSFLV